jgi:hypothetical protein
MDWRLLVAPLGLAIGFGLGWRTIKRIRHPADCSTALLQWSEEPVSAWRENWAGALFITLHSASILVVGLLFLFDPTWRTGGHKLFLIDATPFMPSAARAQFQQDLYGVVIVGLGLVAVLCGNLLAFPFATRWIRPISVCILPDGLVRGPYVWPWSSYSYFSTDPDRYLIRFYPHRARQMASMAWQPADVDLYDQAVALLSRHLPQTPPQEPVPWMLRRTAFLGLGLALLVPYVACALWLCLHAFPWSWLYYIFLTYLVYLLGLGLLRAYQR